MKKKQWCEFCVHSFRTPAGFTGAWDVDVENWVLIQPQGLQDELTANSEPFSPIGYSGRSGARFVCSHGQSCADIDEVCVCHGFGQACTSRRARPTIIGLQIGGSSTFSLIERNQWASPEQTKMICGGSSALTFHLAA